MDSLNRFIVYRKSVQFLALATAIIQDFPKGNAVAILTKLSGQASTSKAMVSGKGRA
jgi:hypothetical protein